MKLVVTERNSLIHKMLVAVDFSNADSCLDLIKQLNDQNERITPQYKYVMTTLATMMDMKKEISEFIIANAQNLS